ncbi:endonuclease/exonuclease/phosphatase family protein [Alteribacter aurantiacus]|uniref:endonuclease/exonuclease/phosphatase family protein n=1 Tax=Alteribacter aurantiacus TaxID=254410 RepID=UPI00041DA0F0|nr:endonuclease/exonuclease/phosphatase family protein [Alteribacter aurantiacus]
MDLNVMTFNLRIDLESDGENSWIHRKDFVADVIRKLQPDIMGTQEATADMISDLNERLPDYEAAGEGRRGGHEDEHCAVFFNTKKINLRFHHTFWLSETPEKKGSKSWGSAYPRICTWVRMECLHTGKQMSVYNTHLDHESQEAREKGIELLLNKMKEDKKEGNSQILMGDFNVSGHNTVLNILNENEQLTNVHSSMGQQCCTFHNFEGKTAGEPIDFIFFSSDLNHQYTEIVKANENGRYPSDHYPVVSVFSPSQLIKEQ